jgi:hypothetical protein
MASASPTNLDWGEQGASAWVTLGFAGYGLGNESTVWLSTLKPDWSWQRNIKPNVPSTRSSIRATRHW